MMLHNHHFTVTKNRIALNSALTCVTTRCDIGTFYARWMQGCLALRD